MDALAAPPPAGPPLAQSASRGGGRQRSTALVAVACLLFVAAVLPSLGRLDFFDGVEHFNLATVQEGRREEAAGRPVNWMLPTLQGEVRVVKPPLTAWLTALLVRPAHAAAISNADPAARDTALSRFVFLARLPTLACAVLLLVGVAVLGHASSAGDWRVGAAAAVVCAGTVLFFQQGRRATTDLQLALWVTWTNALLAVALFRGRPVVGYVLAGAALGLASMAKGPHVALLMTVVPLAVAVAVARRLGTRGAGVGPDVNPTPGRARVVPPLAGLAVALAVGLWWYGYVAAAVDGIGEIWWREVTREGAQVGRNVMMADPWHTYPSLLVPALLPFLAWVAVGAAWAVRGGIGRGTAGGGPLAAACWLVVPLVVMSFFSEKKERYLLPFVSPAAVLAGWAAVRWWDLSRKASPGRQTEARGRARADAIVGTGAGAATFVAATGLLAHVLVAGGLGLKGYRTWDDRPWFSGWEVTVAAGSGLALLAVGVAAAGRSLLVPLAAATAVAFVAGEMRLRGLAAAPGDRDDRPQRELAARVWQEWPDADVYSADPVTLYGQLNRPAIVLSMHLNRVIRTAPADWSAVPTDRPIVRISDTVGEAPPVPPGFRREAEVRLRRGSRYVDVRPAVGR